MKANEIEDFNNAVIKIMTDYWKNGGFKERKLTDLPSDNLQVVPRKYVNMYGSVSGRPQNSVIGQHMLFTDLGYPGWRNQNNAWVSATGSVIG